MPTFRRSGIFRTYLAEVISEVVRKLPVSSEFFIVERVQGEQKLTEHLVQIDSDRYRHFAAKKLNAGLSTATK